MKLEDVPVLDIKVTFEKMTFETITFSRVDDDYIVSLNVRLDNSFVKKTIYNNSTIRDIIDWSGELLDFSIIDLKNKKKYIYDKHSLSFWDWFKKDHKVTVYSLCA